MLERVRVTGDLGSDWLGWVGNYSVTTCLEEVASREGNYPLLTNPRDLQIVSQDLQISKLESAAALRVMRLACVPPPRPQVLPRRWDTRSQGP